MFGHDHDNYENILIKWCKFLKKRAFFGKKRSGKNAIAKENAGRPQNPLDWTPYLERNVSADDTS
ncbi:unnamed protein product [Dovyalis caffra]|uniref:Transposase n=1 Tax=Dovyalis caffra TaxID=77055 RepID=A0AAV1RH63_9ROSI|nr:unnamed protein product [Dovyalis caffra]